LYKSGADGSTGLSIIRLTNLLAYAMNTQSTAAAATTRTTTTIASDGTVIEQAVVADTSSSSGSAVFVDFDSTSTSTGAKLNEVLAFLLSDSAR
jgi:hypothetical protein